MLCVSKLITLSMQTHYSLSINCTLLHSLSLTHKQREKSSINTTMASKLLLALSLVSLLASAAFAQQQRRPFRLTEQQQCRFQRLSAAQPSQTLRSEGGTTELWDERQDQFQCAGVVAMRNTLRPNALSLPNYHPTPRLIFVERGS